MLAGAALDDAASSEDIQYVLDLGLARREAGELLIANAIYGEIIPRELTYVTQYNVASLQQPAWYIRPDGSLDLAQLMAAFQDFFRQHAESWVQRFEYKEAGPQLLLQAFLQRIVNGGGRVEREYGLGRMRVETNGWRVANVQEAKAHGANSCLIVILALTVNRSGLPAPSRSCTGCEAKRPNPRSSTTFARRTYSECLP